jgi:hypothetical protein
MDSQIIMIGNEPLKVEFGVPSQMDVEQTLFMMSQGMLKRSFLDIINNIGDTRDIVTLIQQGINGANRAEGIDKRIDFMEAAKYFDKHMQYIGETAKNAEEMVLLHNAFKESLRNAGLKGMHLDFLIRPTA